MRAVYDTYPHGWASKPPVHACPARVYRRASSADRRAVAGSEPFGGNSTDVTPAREASLRPTRSPARLPIAKRDRCRAGAHFGRTESIAFPDFGNGLANLLKEKPPDRANWAGVWRPHATTFAVVATT